MVMGISSIPQALYMLGKTAIIHELFTTLFGDFDGIGALVRQWSKSVAWISDVGISDGNALISSKTYIFMIKAIWALSCPADSPVVTEAKRFLSEPQVATPGAYFKTVNCYTFEEAVEKGQSISGKPFPFHRESARGH